MQIFSPIQQKIRHVGFQETMKEIGLDLSLTTTHTDTHSKSIQEPVKTRSDGSALVNSSGVSKVSDPKMRLQARRNLNSDGFSPSKSKNDEIIAGVKKLPLKEQREISQAAEIILYFMKKVFSLLKFFILHFNLGQFLQRSRDDARYRPASKNAPKPGESLGLDGENGSASRSPSGYRISTICIIS